MTNNRKPVGRLFDVSKNREDLVMDKKELFIVDMPKEITQYIGSFIDIPNNIQDCNKGLISYTASCKTINNFFQPDLDKLAFKKASEAMIDGREEELKKILDCQPWLVEKKPELDMVIESQLTWQRFYAEELLQMALKRGQLKMVELILPYFKELENGQEKALEQWKKCEPSEEEKKKKEQQYAEKMKALIDIMAKEAFPQGTEKNRRINRISEDTKVKLEAFRKDLLPDGAIRLDDYVDVEQLLRACYRAYIDHFDKFQNQNQRDLYCIAVSGMVQSVLSPELAEIYCECFYDVIDRNQQIGGRAKRLMLIDHKTPFYRPGRDSFTGPGYDFFVGIYAEGEQQASMRGAATWHGCFLKKYDEQKQSVLVTLRENLKKEIYLNTSTRTQVLG